MRSLCLAVAFSALSFAANAAETPSFNLNLKDHAFSPAELTIPADTKVKLVVKNEDSTPAEFESHDLKREKVIAGGKEATILVGPLKKGKYAFFDEFREDTAKGTLIVE